MPWTRPALTRDTAGGASERRAARQALLSCDDCWPTERIFCALQDQRAAAWRVICPRQSLCSVAPEEQGEGQGRVVRALAGGGRPGPEGLLLLCKD